MMHLNHNLYNETTESKLYIEVPELHWQSGHSDYYVAHSLKLRPSATGGLINFESIKLRAVCHYLLDLLPNDGLEEIRESLEDAIKFYLKSPKNEFPQLVSPGFEISLGEVYERPVFQITED
jgi:hypothetical protein